MKWKDYIDATREENNYYTLEEMCEIVGKNNTILDITSVFISKKVSIGSNNIIYPGVIIHADNQSSISIGNSNILSDNTHFYAQNGGKIIVGNSNEFFDGKVSVRSNILNNIIKFSDNGRYDGYINIYGNCEFGTGSQLIGTINVYSCKLLEGADYKELDPNKRAGLLKGIGNARNLVVQVGMVINGFGEFDQDKAELQLNYHKK